MNSLGSEKKNKRQEYLERCIEMSMVNGERREDSMPFTPSRNLDHLTQEQLQLALQQRFQHKEARSNYNYTIMKFISHLIKISLHLFNLKYEDRHNTLT